jgi:uroporphyrinogen decarboxylase
MTKKERALAAIKFKSVDKIPSAYRGLSNLSIRLNKHFGFEEPENLVKNYKKLIEAIGADFYASGSKICKFTTYTARYLGPEPQKPYVKDHAYYYQLGANSKYGEGGDGEKSIIYDVVTDPPLALLEKASDIKDGFLTERLAFFDFGYFDNKYGSKDLSYDGFLNSSDEFICMGNLAHLFMICWALRGYEQFLTDLAFNIKFAKKLINEVCGFAIEYTRRELDAFGNVAEYFGTADDVAGQYGMLFSPEIFKKYFLPHYKKLISLVKSHGVIFSWHCCGSIHKVLPMMIDAGINVFDVVQTSAKNMELENIYRIYGKDVCIHGGVDVQNLLIFKRPIEIKEEVKKVKNLWGNRGGVIVAPSHEALPETPIENILALYEELNS